MRQVASAQTDALVATLPGAAHGPASLYEFSVGLKLGGIGRWGRFGAWLIGAEQRDFAPIADWLVAHQAPRAVLAQQSETCSAQRQGVAIAIEGGEPEFRFYLHGRDASTGRADYRAWRWRRGGPARHAVYEFHFAPESAAGERPERLVPAWARAHAKRLVAEPLFRKSSGFWLRRDPNGRVDQLDLAFPWGPYSRSLGGLASLLDRLVVTDDDRRWIDSVPVRHLAFKPGAADPAATLYTSAALQTPPATEAELQSAVLAAARRDADLSRAAYAALPDAPDPVEGERDLDRFYSGKVELWRRLLGEEMHYHHGLFRLQERRPDHAEMLAASRRAVRELYPFIPCGARVYDIGCGWGGPLSMLARERRGRALGITIAREQFRHVSAMGLPVRWGDAETTLPPGLFDCALLLESFEHIEHKRRLLATLRPFVGRLVMRVNCQDEAPPGPRFGGTMHMISSAALRAMIEQTGWRVLHWRDRRAEAMPSAAAWGRRLAALGPTEDRHIETMRIWCARVLALGDEWARCNPLIEVVAERR